MQQLTAPWAPLRAVPVTVLPVGSQLLRTTPVSAKLGGRERVKTVAPPSGNVELRELATATATATDATATANVSSSRA